MVPVPPLKEHKDLRLPAAVYTYPSPRVRPVLLTILQHFSPDGYDYVMCAACLRSSTDHLKAQIRATIHCARH